MISNIYNLKYFRFIKKTVDRGVCPQVYSVIVDKENRRMKAKEIEQKYGISSQKIKDYKKAGVFKPISTSSSGKAIDYSNEDVELLVKLNVLGKAGVSVKDIREMQDSECSLQEVLVRKEKHLEEKIEWCINSLKLLKEYLALGLTYEEFPTMQQWNVISANMANGIHYYDEFEDTGIDFSRTVTCPCCKKEISINLDDYIYDTSSDEKENGMGPDCSYYFDSGEEVTCDNCSSIVRISGWIREYPIGAYDSENIDVEEVD